ncbi:MAG: GNAT family N-acetyltransferase [Chitinophagaceae bacterium]|nr:GNAT family N-acetyltransferase [Chitinophagaceae bacterium]
MIPLDFNVHVCDAQIEPKLLAFFEAVNDDFVPALSQWVNLFEYAQKLSRNAVCWLVYESEELIGVSACYVNVAPAYSFWTMLAIRKEYRNRMIALPLEQKVISYCKTMGSAGIKAEVDPRHVELIQLHRMFGFEVEQEQILETGRRYVPLTLTFK